jgi:hypothetical protein
LDQFDAAKSVDTRVAGAAANNEAASKEQRRGLFWLSQVVRIRLAHDHLQMMSL